MGLDMYLYAKGYIADYQYGDKSPVAEFIENIGLDGVAVSKDNAVIQIEVGYWRKVYFIHEWFNTKLGELDNCEDRVLPKKCLEELLSDCQRVLEIKDSEDSDIVQEVINETFPLGNEADLDAVFYHLDLTVTMLKNIIGSTKLSGFTFLYGASW
jgi:hypothetical protein